MQSIADPFFLSKNTGDVWGFYSLIEVCSRAYSNSICKVLRCQHWHYFAFTVTSSWWKHLLKKSVLRQYLNLGWICGGWGSGGRADPHLLRLVWFQCVQVPLGKILVCVSELVDVVYDVKSFGCYIKCSPFTVQSILSFGDKISL